MRGFVLMVALCGVAFMSVAAGSQTDDMSVMTPEEIKEAKLKDSHKVVMVGDDDEPCAPQDSIERMINMFYVDQFRHFQDPLAPYFLMMSKDATLAMGIGGAVRMRGWADFDGAMPVNGFCPYLIPVPADPEMRRRLGGTPAGTTLFFRVIGRNTLVKDFNAYIQCDFSGPDNVGFKLRKAYVTMLDWTIGYASTTFSDPAAEAPTIDGAGANGRTSRSSMLVRWMHVFPKGWSMAASVEMPSSHVDADGTRVKRLNDWFPDVVAFGQYEWSHKQHVRLSGMLRVIPYRDLVNMRSRNEIGWGVQLSGVVYPVNRLALYAEANTGQGYNSYMGDLSIGNYDLVESTVPGQMYAPFSLGITAGMKYNFLYNLYACASFGQARYFSRYDVPDDYKRGEYYAVNLFWEMTPRLQVGIEYLHGDRHNFSGEHSAANRVDFLFQFAF